MQQGAKPGGIRPNKRIDALEADIRLLKSENAALRQTVNDIRQLVGPFGIPMPDGTMLTHTIHGQKYFIDPADDVMAPQMIVYRQWEADLSALFLQLIKPDTVFVDVGANFGYFTCLVASVAGDRNNAKVFSYEPNPNLLPLLRRNISINWSSAPVTVFPDAVGAAAGSANLFIPRNRGANSALGGLDEAAIDVDKVDVRVVRIDDTVPADLQINIMKVDVEGFELPAMQGAEETIRRSPDLSIIMEWSQDQMRSSGHDPRELADYLKSLGLTPFSIDLAPQQLAARHALSWPQILEQGYMNLHLRRM